MEDRRVFARIDVSLSLKFLDLSTGLEGKGETINISGNGVCFLTREELIPETSLGIWFYMPEYKEPPLYVHGKVVWSKVFKNGDGRRVGVCIEVDNKELMGLGKLLQLHSCI